jgi:hypothetical protein
MTIWTSYADGRTGPTAKNARERPLCRSGPRASVVADLLTQPVSRKAPSNRKLQDREGERKWVAAESFTHAPGETEPAVIEVALDHRGLLIFVEVREHEVTETKATSQARARYFGDVCSYFDLQR